MDMTEIIQKLNKAHSENKLVVFIGAGVSRNSHLPLWNDLVREMDIELENSPAQDYRYSNDELLRIPQYLSESNPSRYYAIINELYGKWPKETNPIIDEVLNLNPHHIITTNFDFLIECSMEKMKRASYIEGHRHPFYVRIRKDDDLVGNDQDQLFIKMHGDVEVPDSLVLKEDEYLGYSHSHVLIETIIKSLLIDHTFLFIGYGIGDYNLKLIMNWVDVLLKKYEESQPLRRPHFFFHAGSQPMHEHEIKYYAKKNVQVVSADSFPENIKTIDITVFEQEQGNNCLRFLKYLKQGPYPEDSTEYLMEKLSLFSSQPMILYEDLGKVLNFYLFSASAKIGNVLYLQHIPLEWSKAFLYLLSKAEAADGSEEAAFFKSIINKPTTDWK